MLAKRKYIAGLKLLSKVEPFLTSYTILKDNLIFGVFNNVEVYCTVLNASTVIIPKVQRFNIGDICTYHSLRNKTFIVETCTSSSLTVNNIIVPVYTYNKYRDIMFIEQGKLFGIYGGNLNE